MPVASESDSDENSDLTKVETNDYYALLKVQNRVVVREYTAQALYEQINSCDINLEPEYQRDVVWPAASQICLIDSLFRNFYLPPVIFAVNTYEDGSEIKACIDGKQTLIPIRKFMDGLIPHKDSLTGEKLWYKDMQTVGRTSRGRRLLPDAYKKTFANKMIACIEYKGITDADEREIFQRVHLGIALTPLEKLRAINTPRASFIRQLQTTYLNEDGWLGGDTLEWDRSRDTDFRCLSQGVFFMENISGNLEGVTMVQLESWLNLGDFFRSDLRAKILDTYRIFVELVQNPEKKPAKISPVEFTTIGLLVFAHKDTMTMAQLSAAIAKMREDARVRYVGIRMDTELRVMKTMIDFIKSLKIAKIPATTGGPAGVAGSTAGLKRKRAEQQSDGEDEGEQKNDNGKRGKQGYKKSKPKKSSTAATSNAKPSGSVPASKVSLPSRVKAEPGSSPVVHTQVPKPPPPDRMAALGDNITQKQQQPSALPAVPRALPSVPSSLTGFGPPNPQIHPSPGQSFSVLRPPSNISLPNDTSNQNAYKHTPNNTKGADNDILNNNPNMNVVSHNTGMNTTIPLPVSSSQNVMEPSLIATMMRKCRGYFKQAG